MLTDNFKNLKTEKEKIEFLKEKIKEYFVPFYEKTYIEKDKWGRWSFANLPTQEEFLVKYCVDFDYWEKVKTEPDLKHEVARAHAIVKDIVIKGGASGAFNPKFASLMAQNLFNWTAKSETKDSSRKSSVIVNIINERRRRKLPVIVDTTAKTLTNQKKLTKLTQKTSLDSEKANEDIPVVLDEKVG